MTGNEAKLAGGDRVDDDDDTPVEGLPGRGVRRYRISVAAADRLKPAGADTIMGQD